MSRRHESELESVKKAARELAEAADELRRSGALATGVRTTSGMAALQLQLAGIKEDRAALVEAARYMAEAERIIEEAIGDDDLD